MFQHLGDFKNISGSHLVRKIFEAVLPIAGGRGEICCQSLKEGLAFNRTDGPTETNFHCIGDGNQDQGIGCGESKRIKRKRYGPDLLLLNLFDCADTVVGVNDFLADLEAHLNTSDCFYEHQASRTLWLIDKKLYAKIGVRVVLELIRV